MNRIVMVLLGASLLGGTMPTAAMAQKVLVPAKDEAAKDITKDATKAGPPSQRYRFSHTAEGVLRLDNETGQVVLCRALGNGWACNPAPDETAVLQVELKRKDEEVRKLTTQFDQLKADFARSQSAGSDQQKALQGDVTRLQAELAALRNEIAALAAQGNESGKQAITQEERQSMVSRLALLEQDNGGLHGALKRLQDENAALKKQIADAPKPPDLEPAVTQSLTSIDALRRELAAAKEQVAALGKQLADQGSRPAQQAEIDQLKDENRTLVDKLAALEENNAAMRSEIDALKPSPPLPKADVPADRKDELKLPSREELERARAAVVDAWRRVMEMIGQLQKDMMGSRADRPVRL